jgi:hypothetical protein
VAVRSVTGFPSGDVRLRNIVCGFCATAGGAMASKAAVRIVAVSRRTSLVTIRHVDDDWTKWIVGRFFERADSSSTRDLTSSLRTRRDVGPQRARHQPQPRDGARSSDCARRRDR